MPYEDDLAYGDYHGQGQESDTERGFVGDVYRRFRGKHSNIDPYQQPPSSSKPPKQSGMSFVFDKLHQAVHGLGSDIKAKLTQEGEVHSHTHTSGECTDGTHDHHKDNRFLSFAPQREGNDIKWYVDGCGYMWAVSVALEQARESIWILDWWLSPELYLRRPPAKFEQYRVDRMLQAAAERGVKVNIIVYKEVTQALTLSSAHTKHELEALHPNIAVFRHPDHLPDRQTVASDFISSVQNLNLTAATATKLPVDALKALYGTNDATVLFWAHHEKLCLIDGKTAFMGGLDLCYGRWDTNQHAIADVHPSNLDDIVFPGQDYNNARIMDFQDVTHWQNNKLDRTKSSRMGWSDVSLCLSGPAVWDLQNHFVQRWNLIYYEKYNVRKDVRYSLLSLDQPAYSSRPSGGYGQQQGYSQQPGYRGGEEYGERGYEDGGQGFLGGREGGFRDQMHDRFHERKERMEGEFGFGEWAHGRPPPEGPDRDRRTGNVNLQLTRSCAKWSHGVNIEHSIANAYIETIRDSQHFVYIENQFFITATGDKQKPVKNMIGAAIVERIVRAYRNGEKYKMIVMIPAIPAFAGDLRADDALSTRAIMEFQYNSINRGHGYSIYEQIAKEGANPMEYIRFFNLRNYDRINASSAMKEAEQKSGVSYEEARKQYDATYGGGFSNNGQQPPAELEGAYGANGPYDQGAYGQGRYPGGYNPSGGYGERPQYAGNDPYGQYQQGAAQVGSKQGLGTGRWDSVAECYMLGGEDIRNVPWESGDMDEIDAFVSEELYIHSKLLIADDRTVICGSANLNDRSQLGDHDSEIAIVIDDPTPVDSMMDGRPWRASRFAASLRRQLFRKHLGLLRPQDMTRPDENYLPIGHAPNIYDWNSTEDRIVADPLADNFLDLWNSRAKSNTDCFARLFHPVPFDGVRNWKQYDEFYERFFKEEEKEKGKKMSLYKWGHVVAEEFPGGVQEVKEVLSRIKGTLVEMPLMFLNDEDIAKEGLGLNAFTEEVYT